jgi:branched-chain amino acid transport system substrate-binding protein
MTAKIRPVLLAIVVCLALGVLVAACGNTSTSSNSNGPSSSEPIKIGHITDLTGPVAMAGKLMDDSLRLAFDQMGNQIAGHPVQIITGDAANDYATAVDVARKMVQQDHVACIIGPMQEKTSVAAYCASVGVPMIEYAPTPVDFFQGSKVNKWVFSVCGSDQLASCMADYVYNHLHYRTVVTFTAQESGFHEFMDPFIKTYTAEGGKVVQEKWCTYPCTDFTPYLTTLKQADAIVAYEPGADSIAFNTQFHQMGLDKKYHLVGAFHGGVFDPFVVDNMPKDIANSLVGDLTVMPYSPDSQAPVNLAFVKTFTKKFGYPPGDDGSAGPFQAAALVKAALEATKGSTSPDALVNAMKNVKMTGVEGPIAFDNGTTCATVNEYIVKVTKFGPKAYGYTTVYTYQNVPPQGYTPAQ